MKTLSHRVTHDPGLARSDRAAARHATAPHVPASGPREVRAPGHLAEIAVNAANAANAADVPVVRLQTLRLQAAWRDRLRQLSAWVRRAWPAHWPGARVAPPQPRVVDVVFGQPYRVPAAGGAWVRCLDGTAWLTRDGRRLDTVLLPGDTTQVRRADDPLVVGLPHCRLRIAARREQLDLPDGGR